MLDPIQFGFMTSLERYAELRRRDPDVEILMGTGNLTELTDADRWRRDAQCWQASALSLKFATCSSCRCPRIRAARSKSTTRRGAGCIALHEDGVCRRASATRFFARMMRA